MAEVIRMPRMSDTMTEGVIVSWLKKEGEQVKRGELLAEVETDKATMELESFNDGVLLHIGVPEGEAVPVEGVIAVIGKEGEDWKKAIEEAGGAAGGGTGQVKEAPKGQEKKQEAAPASKDKQEQQPAALEQKTSGEAQPRTQPEKAGETGIEEVSDEEDGGDEGRVKASPLARALAKERGIDLASLKGTGDGGRIVRRDIEGYKEGQVPAQKEQVQAPAQKGVPAEGQYEEVKISQMRKTIARRLSESKFSAPHFYLTVSVDASQLMEFRSKINNALGEKVSFNDIIIKCAAMALRRHPKVNSSWQGDTIRINHQINIGVAVAVDEGLIVPVVRTADMKGIGEISRDIKELADKAQHKKLQPEEFSGNTFTISNLGMFGIEEFTAIINPPDACILAVGAIADQPVVKNGEVVAGKVMRMTLSCDHRVVDGATGARFLQTLKGYLEEPITILA